MYVGAVEKRETERKPKVTDPFNNAVSTQKLKKQK